MAPSRAAVCWCVVLCALSPFDTASADWLQRQSGHKSVRLEDYNLLRRVALLAEKEDPEGQVFERLLRPLLRPRYVTTQQHHLVRMHLIHTMSALGWHVDGNNTFYSKTPRGRLPFTNVIATHDIDAPRRLVLACHYDSIYGRDTFSAATDSAVPCAMMLYLATLMTHEFLDPVRGRAELTLQLMFFDGEEAIDTWTDQDSIYGSRRLAESLHAAVYTTVPSSQQRRSTVVNQLHRIDLMVLLDLLGARQPSISNYIDNSAAQFRQLASVETKLARAGLLLDGVPRVFHFRRSWGVWGAPRIADDHLPFLERGVKVLHLIPHPFPEVWHKDSDNEAVIHYPTVHNLNRVLRVFVLEYLNTPAYLAST